MGRFGVGIVFLYAVCCALRLARYNSQAFKEERKAFTGLPTPAAAHAGCFAMALSAQLGEAGMVAESIHATATVTLEKVAAGWTVTQSHLEVAAKIPGADPAAFDKAANNAKAGCPISRLLNARITMAARLE